jgi:hypothetical protein
MLEAAEWARFHPKTVCCWEKKGSIHSLWEQKSWLLRLEENKKLG